MSTRKAVIFFLWASGAGLLAGGGEQDDVVGEVGVADEVLGAVDEVAVAVPDRRATHASQIGAGVGLAHRQAFHPVSPNRGDRRYRSTCSSRQACRMLEGRATMYWRA